jgi:hypothetical protein
MFQVHSGWSPHDLEAKRPLLGCARQASLLAGANQLQTSSNSEGRYFSAGMCCRNAARRNTPPIALEEKSGLGLRPSEAELSRVLSTAPCRVVRAQCTQFLGNVILSKPFDLLGNSPGRKDSVFSEREGPLTPGGVAVRLPPKNGPARSGLGVGRTAIKAATCPK